MSGASLINTSRRAMFCGLSDNSAGALGVDTSTVAIGPPLNSHDTKARWPCATTRLAAPGNATKPSSSSPGCVRSSTRSPPTSLATSSSRSAATTSRAEPTTGVVASRWGALGVVRSTVAMPLEPRAT